jgi:hypothetical protein
MDSTTLRPANIKAHPNPKAALWSFPQIAFKLHADDLSKLTGMTPAAILEPLLSSDDEGPWKHIGGVKVREKLLLIFPKTLQAEHHLRRQSGHALIERLGLHPTTVMKTRPFLVSIAHVGKDSDRSDDALVKTLESENNVKKIVCGRWWKSMFVVCFPSAQEAIDFCNKGIVFVNQQPAFPQPHNLEWEDFFCYRCWRPAKHIAKTCDKDARCGHCARAHLMNLCAKESTPARCCNCGGAHRAASVHCESLPTVKMRKRQETSRKRGVTWARQDLTEPAKWVVVGTPNAVTHVTHDTHDTHSRTHYQRKEQPSQQDGYASDQSWVAPAASAPQKRPGRPKGSKNKRSAPAPVANEPASKRQCREPALDRFVCYSVKQI